MKYIDCLEKFLYNYFQIYNLIYHFLAFKKNLHLIYQHQHNSLHLLINLFYRQSLLNLMKINSLLIT